MIFQGRKWSLHIPEFLRLEQEFQAATKPFPSLRNGLEITRSDEVGKSLQSLKRTGAIQCVFKREAPEASCREEASPAGNSDKRILPKNCDLIEGKWQGGLSKRKKLSFLTSKSLLLIDLLRSQMP